MNIFAFNSYTKVISELTRSKKLVDPKVNFSHLAESIGVQKTYLSKVINGGAHLNSDQLYDVCRYFDLAEPEDEYLNLLLEVARTQSTRRRQELQQKIKQIQASRRVSKEYIKATATSPNPQDALSTYYLNPLLVLVHIFLTVPQFQKNPSLIAGSLDISPDKLQGLLKTLQELELIAWDSKTAHYKVIKDYIHLETQSTLHPVFQTLMRSMASSQMLKLETSAKMQTAIVFSAEEETYAYVQEQFLEFLKKIEGNVRDAAATHVYQLNFDFFPWS